MNDNFKNILFPIIYYDQSFKYPLFKILENRVLNFIVFISYEELISDPDNWFEINSYPRMIDSNGNEYSTNYSKILGFNAPDVQPIALKSLEEIQSLLEPHLNRNKSSFKDEILKCKTISEMLKKLAE